MSAVTVLWHSYEIINEKTVASKSDCFFSYLHRTRNSYVRNQFPALMDRVFDISAIWCARKSVIPLRIALSLCLL